MGNQQTNERQRNHKVCKITSIDEHSGWIRCNLDDDVPYSNGERRYMDFETDTTLNVLEGVSVMFLNYSGPMQASLREGAHILIDTDTTREYESSHNFSRRSVTNLNELATSLPGEGGLQGLIEEIIAAREMRARANEWADFAKKSNEA